jgi:hypothetical protein
VQNHLRASESRVLSFGYFPLPRLTTATPLGPSNFPPRLSPTPSLKVYAPFQYEAYPHSQVDDALKTQHRSRSSHIYRVSRGYVCVIAESTTLRNLQRLHLRISVGDGNIRLQLFSSLAAGWAGIIKTRRSLSGLREPPKACACRLVVAVATRRSERDCLLCERVAARIRIFNPFRRVRFDAFQ